VGEGDAKDFTALGDAVNTTARHTEAAAPGEILVSAATASAAELLTDGVERRTLTVRGREQPIDVWVATA
jgi:adenylate cyclase